MEKRRKIKEIIQMRDENQLRLKNISIFAKFIKLWKKGKSET